VPVLEHYLTEVRPLLGPGRHPAMWVTERRGRMSRRRLDRAFNTVRDLAGLDPELSAIKKFPSGRGLTIT